MIQIAIRYDNNSPGLEENVNKLLKELQQKGNKIVNVHLNENDNAVVIYDDGVKI